MATTDEPASWWHNAVIHDDPVLLLSLMKERGLFTPEQSKPAVTSAVLQRIQRDCCYATALNCINAVLGTVEPKKVAGTVQYMMKEAVDNKRVLVMGLLTQHGVPLEMAHTSLRFLGLFFFILIISDLVEISQASSSKTVSACQT